MWEGGSSLHTEILEVMHVKKLRSKVTPCIKKADQHTTSVIANTIIWSRVQPLAQNSSPYLYNVNHNILSLLLGSHEDL